MKDSNNQSHAKLVVHTDRGEAVMYFNYDGYLLESSGIRGPGHNSLTKTRDWARREGYPHEVIML